jgi:hypothetical protein
MAQCRRRRTSLSACWQPSGVKAHGLHGVRVIGAYHARRVAPIMAWTLSLYQMGSDVIFLESVMSTKAIHDMEIA